MPFILSRVHGRALNRAALLGGLLVVSALVVGFAARKHQAGSPLPLTEADDKRITYMGRVDFSNPKRPRFWAPGVTIQARFQGSTCDVVINDEVLWGKSHNYLEVVVDNQTPFRLQTTGKENTLRVADGLPAGPHTITICKNTEAGIGYLEFVGFRSNGGLLAAPPKPPRKLEFIGDSITCGMGSDLTIPCGKGEWYDQHNAFQSYGPATARHLNAQWHLTSVSGIGLMHSCCDMKETMPDVWATADLKASGRPWDFKRYQPDILFICLGQNDGQQAADAFVSSYVQFIGTLRAAYPKAQIVCLTSPMGDAGLVAYQKAVLARVVQERATAGDKKVRFFAFAQHYGKGCGGHPDIFEHQQIAGELSGYVRSTFGWKPAPSH